MRGLMAVRRHFLSSPGKAAPPVSASVGAPEEALTTADGPS